MATEARWVSRHWWSTHLELKTTDAVIARVNILGTKGTAEIRGTSYTLRRLRLPEYVTLRDRTSDELVARLCLIPKHGFKAEFEDGESYRLGWVRFLTREWSWTNECGEFVLASRRPFFGQRTELLIGEGPSAARWPFLAVLELAALKLSVPWL